MKTIRIKFVDFYKDFDYRTLYLFKFLEANYKVEVVDKPDYLVYSVFGFEHLNYDCVKIFLTGENLVPDFNLCDYGLAFDYIQLEDRYYRFPLYFSPKYDAPRNAMQEKHLNVSLSDYDRKFCSFVYSNSKAAKIRDQIYMALSQYKLVDSGGRHLNNIGGPVEDKFAFESMHKFSIACENSSHSGYETEKLVEAFAARTVPIYWGSPTVKETFNKEAFINVSDFTTLEELVEYVKIVDSNPDLYLKMLRAPALKNTNSVEEVYKGMDIFLHNIFDQELESAFRRNRVFWGENYVSVFRKMKFSKDKPLQYFLSNCWTKIEGKITKK